MIYGYNTVPLYFDRENPLTAEGTLKSVLRASLQTTNTECENNIITLRRSIEYEIIEKHAKLLFMIACMKFYAVFKIVIEMKLLLDLSLKFKLMWI